VLHDFNTEFSDPPRAWYGSGVGEKPENTVDGKVSVSGS
jgi:hypothetical protein